MSTVLGFFLDNIFLVLLHFKLIKIICTFEAHFNGLDQQTLLLKRENLINENLRLAERYFDHICLHKVAIIVVFWIKEVVFRNIVELEVTCYSRFDEVVYALRLREQYLWR